MTAANVRSSQSSHYYFKNGSPCYELPKKTSAGMRKPTIADARALGLLPSVTTILKVMHKPALQDWITAQAVLAVLTTPRKDGENTDAFVHRVLQVERVQDQEAKTAADRGSEIHDAIENAINGGSFDDQWKPYVESALSTIEKLGKVVWSEKILVGEDYAGRADILIDNQRDVILLDFKSAKILPKESYPDHRMQTAAYAKTLGNTGERHIVTGNLYLSTTLPGASNLCLQENWLDAYENGFRKLLDFWKWINNYNL